MKKPVFTILAILSLHGAHAASELTDILFNRMATFEERQSVSDTLAGLGKQQPLTVMDAIAEVCYEVDLCAGLSDETQYPYPSYCDDVNSDPEVPTLSNECYPKYFKEKYSCNPEREKQSFTTVKIAGKLIFDLKALYNSYIKEYFTDALSRQYGVDFRELANNRAALEEFFRKNPLAKIRIETMANETYSLAAYTLDCYMPLNSILYSKDQSRITRYYNLYRAIINTMGIFPEFKQKVNRGASLPAAVLKEHHQIGNIVCYNGFTSTAVHDPKTDMTDKPRNSFLSGKCTQRLYISYDERSLGGRSISKGSALTGENEVLFEPGACFRIDNVYPRTDPPTEDDGNYECEEGQHYNFEMTLVR